MATRRAKPAPPAAAKQPVQKPWYKSKTIIAGVIVAAIGLAENFIEDGLIPDEYSAFTLMGVGVLQVVLRFLTSGAVGVKS